MAVEQVAVTISRDKIDVSWYAVYVALRRFGPITHVRSEIGGAETKSYIATLRENLKRAHEATFVLSRSDETDELRLLTELDCGSINAPIKSVRNVRNRPLSHNTGRESVTSIAGCQSSSESIADVLSYDCLYEIFAHTLLDMPDLCAIAGACTPFYESVGPVIRKRLRGSKLHVASDKWSVEASEVLFADFGQYITSIRLDDSDIYADIMLGFVAKYCVNVVELVSYRMDAIVPAVKQYNELPVSYQQKILQPFGHLNNFEFIAPKAKFPPTAPVDLPAVKLPSLRRLSLTKARLCDRSNVEAFFAMNNGLKAVHLDRVQLPAHVNHIFRHLVNVSDLAVLHCRWHAGEHAIDDDAMRDAYDDWRFHPMKKLTKFTLQVFHANDAERIVAGMRTAQAPIKYLELRICQLPPFFEHLGVEGFELNFILAMVAQMPAIEELQIYGPKLMDDILPLIEFVVTNPGVELISNGLTGTGRMDGFRRVRNAPAVAEPARGDQM